ncbi:CAP domain-containing protein [Streptomyces flavidovirens]|uniref:CAP domain-containing protein n=1 Tax=Streptomyces flavidovirens TaxID=67298 RepID=UPI000411FB27|nr:CAP domain-containing protein [Streptomyces flavidovirens]
MRGPTDRKVRRRATTVLLLLSLAATTPAATTAEPPPPAEKHTPSLPDPWEETWQPPTGHTYRPRAQAALVRLLNRERIRNGCRPLRTHPAVTRAAQRHSDYMARVGELSHTGAHASRPGDRLTDEGYRWHRVAENLARSKPKAATALRLWKNSPKHRAAMLTCAYHHAGVGMSTRDGQGWWTLLLATRR